MVAERLCGQLRPGLPAGAVQSAAWYRPSQTREQSALRPRIRELAQARSRLGYLRIWVLLRREAWPINRKRVRPLYRLERLQVRIRVRRRTHMALHHAPAPVPAGPRERWGMDLVHDALADGRPFRVLTVVDHWSRQSPVPEVAASMSGMTVGAALDRVLEYRRGLQLDFIPPDKPVENPLIERLTPGCGTNV